MKNWTETLNNPEKLNIIFSNEIQDLKQIDLHEVSLSRDGPSVFLRFDLPNFPESPPEKWRINGLNCVQVILRGLGIKYILIDHWPPVGLCDLSINTENNLILIQSDNCQSRIIITVEILMIDKVEAYYKEKKVIQVNQN